MRYVELIGFAILLSAVPLLAHSDPAILKGANGVACQIPNNLLDASVTQFDATPNDVSDVEINTKLTQFGVLADGACRGQDTKEIPAFIKNAFPALPYQVKFNNLKGKYGAKIYCRMEDSDNTVYFTPKWFSLLKVQQAGINNVKITYQIVCLNGRSR